MAVRIYVVIALMLCAAAAANSERLEPRDIIRRIEELEERDRSQQAELETLRKQNVEMETEINQLKDRDEQQANRIKILEEEGRAMLEAINELMDNDKGRTGDTSESQTNDETVQSVNGSSSRRDKINMQEGTPSEGHNRIRQAGDGMTVAFFATMTNDADHLGIHQTLVFDNAITNIANAYHASGGIFTAPVSGVYVFSTTIIGYSSSAHYNYVVNGKFMCRLYIHSAGDYETSSMTVVFNLNGGDDVAIQNVDSDKLVIGSHYSTFSGFLLSQNVVNSQIVG